ncbi:MAG: VapC toxin family PIN domain ribonuclease [Pseudonocardiales bacterium]|nr:MAG: VapC toxin family PIN domain ribonuclease [Pseudonocardiales bacterium]
MTVLLDSSVLIGLALPDHVHHQSAESWFASANTGFATCPITQGALVRMLIREHKTAPRALEVLRLTMDHPRHEFWADHVSYLDARVDGVFSHRQVTDAYLAALARARGARLATFDRGFAALHPDVTDLVPVGG